VCLPFYLKNTIRDAGRQHFFSSKFPSFIKRFSLLLCYSFFKNSQIPSRLFTKESLSLFIYSTKMSSPDCPFVRISLKFSLPVLLFRCCQQSHCYPLVFLCFILGKRGLTYIRNRI